MAESKEWPKDEKRMIPIMQNGNTGEHYSDANKALLILDDAIERTKWFEELIYNMNGKIPVDLTKERVDLEWLVKQVEEEM